MRCILLLLNRHLTRVRSLISLVFICFASSAVCEIPKLHIATATIPEGTPLRAYSFRIRATGGVRPYQFGLSAGALPPGIRLDSRGVLTGAPTIDNGHANFSVVVRDKRGKRARRRLSLSVSTVGVTIPYSFTSQGVVSGDNCLTKVHFEFTGNFSPRLGFNAYVGQNPKSPSGYAFLSWNGTDFTYALSKVFAPQEDSELFISPCGTPHLLVRVICSSFFSPCS